MRNTCCGKRTTATDNIEFFLALKISCRKREVLRMSIRYEGEKMMEKITPRMAGNSIRNYYLFFFFLQLRIQIRGVNAAM